MKTYLIKSYGKINLCLNITGKTDDGFHTVDIVSLPVEMHDSLLLKQIKNKDRAVVTSDDFMAGMGRHNLVTKAILLFLDKAQLNKQYHVDIHKVVPIQAGMGGGSSNAAFILMKLNEIHHHLFSDKEIKEMALSLGADVPFFLGCVPSRCQGIGEIVTPIEVKNNYYVLIVKPARGCSTKEVYEKSNDYDIQIKDVDTVIEALANGDDELLANSIFNDLQNPAVDILPEIKVIIEMLKGQFGLKIVQMTGSGSAVFALSQNKKELENIIKQIYKDYYVELTRIKKGNQK